MLKVHVGIIFIHLYNLYVIYYYLQDPSFFIMCFKRYFFLMNFDDSTAFRFAQFANAEYLLC